VSEPEHPDRFDLDGLTPAELEQEALVAEVDAIVRDEAYRASQEPQIFPAIDGPEAG
jgi:hypothetical protein